MSMNELERLKQKEMEAKNRNVSIGLGLSLLALFFSFILPAPGMIVGAIGARLCMSGLQTARHKHAKVGIFAGCAAILMGILVIILNEYILAHV